MSHRDAERNGCSGWPHSTASGTTKTEVASRPTMAPRAPTDRRAVMETGIRRSEHVRPTNTPYSDEMQRLTGRRQLITRSVVGGRGPSRCATPTRISTAPIDNDRSPLSSSGRHVTKANARCLAYVYTPSMTSEKPSDEKRIYLGLNRRPAPTVPRSVSLAVNGLGPRPGLAWRCLEPQTGAVFGGSINSRDLKPHKNGPPVGQICLMHMYEAGCALNSCGSSDSHIEEMREREALS